MDSIVGVLMFLYGVGVVIYSYFSEDFTYTNSVYAQLVVAFGGALVIAAKSGSIEKLKSLLGFFKKSPELSGDYSKSDYDALVYLRQRAVDINSEKAYELVSELNQLLFDSKKNTFPQEGKMDEE